MTTYLLENITKGDLLLSRPTSKGVKTVRPKGRFEADETTYQQIKGSVRVIQILSENQGNSMEKIITEQPPTVTTEGTVEYVKVDKKARKLNEQSPGQSDADVLLNESPLEGIEIV
jgi:hypothetical protein